MSASDLARSFERSADEYERGRPGWPEAALDALGLPPSTAVLDLAAGTGKLTRLLVPRFARVVAVEPLASMRRLLERLVSEAEVLEGSAEAIPVPDASFDAVTVAEAFHWFATPAAVAEIARALRPGGTLALLWNEPTGPFAPAFPPHLAARVNALRLERKTDVERHETGVWRDAFAGGPFERFREERIPHEHVLDREGVVAQLASMSFVAALPEPERAALLADARAALPDGPFRRPLETRVFWARRAP